MITFLSACPFALLAGWFLTGLYRDRRRPSYSLRDLTGPARRDDLDRPPVCEACGSDDRTPIGGIWACGRCGCEWAAS